MYLGSVIQENRIEVSFVEISKENKYLQTISEFHILEERRLDTRLYILVLTWIHQLVLTYL